MKFIQFIQFIKRINVPLIIGISITLLLAVVSLYPEYIADCDPNCKETFRYDSETNDLYVPPVKPGKAYIWGTDEKGRDLQSLVIYGCKTTIAMALSVAIGRLLIALPFAIAAGYKNRFVAKVIDMFNTIFNAFPIIMLILLLKKNSIFVDFLGNPMTIAVAIMIIFGWGKLAKQLLKLIENVLSEDFIEGEVAIGKTKLNIAVNNVIPHIIPSTIVLFFLEIAVALLLLSQAGVLGLVLDAGYVNTKTDSLNVLNEFDWASLLVFAHYLSGTSKMWMITYPALAFAVSIIGFNLLGEGLRIELEKRQSRIISFIRKIPEYFSPLKFVYELKNYKAYKSSILKKISFLCIVLLIVAILQPHSSIHKFDSLEAFKQVQQFGSNILRYRENDSTNRVIAENYLAEKLEEYGTQPYDGKYIHELVFQNEKSASIIGIIPGKDAICKNDIIIIGTSITDIENSMGEGTHNALIKSGASIELQLAKMLAQASEKPDRTVVFAFWNHYEGVNSFIKKYINIGRDNVFYIDIGDVANDKFIIDTSGVKPRNKNTQDYLKIFKKNMRKNDLDIVYKSINRYAKGLFLNIKQDVLALDSINSAYIVDSGKNIDKDKVTTEELKKFHKIGQTITDTVYDIVYDK